MKFWSFYRAKIFFKLTVEKIYFRISELKKARFILLFVILLFVQFTISFDLLFVYFTIYYLKNKTKIYFFTVRTFYYFIIIIEKKLHTKFVFDWYLKILSNIFILKNVEI